MAKTEKLRTDYFWILAVVTMVLLAMAMVAGLSLVREFDSVSTKREETVVANGVRGRMAEVAQLVTPQLVWDDAVRNLDNRFDHQWAAQNIAAYLHSSSGFDAAFVLDRHNRPIFGSKDGRPVDPQKYVEFGRETASLLLSVRHIEASRRASAQLVSNLHDPVQHSTFARVNDELVILTATLVQPDFGTARLLGAQAPVVLTSMKIDQQFLQDFGRRYLLEDLELINRLSSDTSHAQVVLRNNRGDQIAVLRWRPQNPGMKMLGRIGAPTMGLLLILAAAALTFLRRGRKMTEGLIASEARAAHLAYYDALTGHPNRVLFFDRLRQALNQIGRSESVVAIHAIDLDRFKEINDTFGHHIGDELIFQAAKRLAATCRVTETFARLSGDEFAIVQPNADPDGAARLAQRLCEAMAEPFDLGSGRVFTGCSIGVTLIKEVLVEPGEALRQADLALYRAKAAGKGQYCFFEVEMDAAIRNRREMEDDLRDALASDQLSLVYQPQVGRGGGMSGVEALIRWNHPTHGPISPNFFIPVAEQSSLILQIGLFALRRAFEDGKRWRDIKIAVNVSATQLRVKSFVEEVAALVRELDVNPRQFELEITEGILLGDDPETQARLSQLRSMGFTLALDDFGTGYSSLSYLQRYPIDKIKIDRSFISNLGIEEEAGALVGAIVKLARALKLSVIAEGVETSDQLAHLSALGCSDVQGYYFSKPVSATEIDALYNERHRAIKAGKTIAA